MARRRTLSHPRCSHLAGMTLAELVVVVAIFLILAALAVPALQSGDVAGSQVRRVLADAMRTRSLARTSWEATVLRPDTVSGRWRAERADGTPIVSQDTDPNGWRELQPGVSFREIANVPSVFTFLPNGRGNERAALLVVHGSTTWLLELEAMSGALRAEEQ